MKTSPDPHAPGAAKHEYRKPDLSRRERLTEIAEGVIIRLTAAQPG